MIDIIEKAITDRIKEEFKTFSVDSFPVDFEKFTYTSPEGCILVRFEKSDIIEQQSITSVTSYETYSYSVFFSKRYAFKHSDSYGYLNKLKRVLNGMPILNKRLVLSGREFLDEINGDLWYGYSVYINLPVQDEYKDLSEANSLII